jgi:hypothetical protein
MEDLWSGVCETSFVSPPFPLPSVILLLLLPLFLIALYSPGPLSCLLSGISMSIMHKLSLSLIQEAPQKTFTRFVSSYSPSLLTHTSPSTLSSILISLSLFPVDWAMERCHPSRR